MNHTYFISLHESNIQCIFIRCSVALTFDYKLDLLKPRKGNEMAMSVTIQFIELQVEKTVIETYTIASCPVSLMLTADIL